MWPGSADPGHLAVHLPTPACPPLFPQRRCRRSKCRRGCSLSPAAAVLEAWMVLSRAVEKLAIRHGLGETKPYMGRTFETAKKLKEKDVFSTKIMVLLADLRKTRNAAAHAREVDAESAIRYIDLVGRFLKLIEDL